MEPCAQTVAEEKRRWQVIKDFVIGAIMVAFMAVYFSTAYMEDIQPSGIIPRQKGDSGVVLIVKGAASAMEQEEHGGSSDVATEDEIPIEIQKGEQDSMNDMFLVFWHGVAAVLIGEASALCVAAAWYGIRGGSKHG